jgi:hypothetical protein
MKSPFPGMDPYIEGCGLWGDFHDSLIADIKRALSDLLPERYVARSRERSYIVLVECEEKDERHFEPDIKVIGRGLPRRGRSNGGGVALANGDSVAIRAFIEEDFTESFIEIYELEPKERLVTSIEVLSPSNKRKGTPGWKKYLRKRQALLLGKANLVEIDLLRGGTRMPMLDPWPESPYYVLVSRERSAPLCRAWPAHFDRPLPTIPIPLSKPDPDIALALQPLVDGIYERSRYDHSIDYARPLKPPLTEKQATWLKGLLRAEHRPPKRSRRRS